MTDAPNPVLAEIWRGDLLECVHRGTAVVARASGEIVEAWGDPARVVLPRSACKMLQALPLVESGAADAAGLGARHLALACASHQGAAVHVGLAANWLREVGLAEADLRCGAHKPNDREERVALARAGAAPTQLHNNCSGKHCGMLTLNRHLGGDPEYLDIDHPVQVAIRAAIAEVAGEEPAGHAIDGCSAPNFALSLGAFATALARFADPSGLGGRRGEAAERLTEAMRLHPELVAGEGRACTALMRAGTEAEHRDPTAAQQAKGFTGINRRIARFAVKTGAEGVFAAILPEKGLGIALKIDDGATRGSEAAMAALLARHGALEPDDPAVTALAAAPQRNWRGIETGSVRAHASLW